MDGNGETTIFYVMIWNHPVETTIKKLVCLEFQVIHNCQRQRIFRLKKKNTNPSCLPFQMAMENPPFWRYLPGFGWGFSWARLVSGRVPPTKKLNKTPSSLHPLRQSFRTIQLRQICGNGLAKGLGRFGGMFAPPRMKNCWIKLSL